MLFALIIEPLLLKSIEDYRDLIHLMSSKGTVTFGCDYSFFYLTLPGSSILLLMIYNVRGEDKFSVLLGFFCRFLP